MSTLTLLIIEKNAVLQVEVVHRTLVETEIQEFASQYAAFDLLRVSASGADISHLMLTEEFWRGMV
jgi:hypothetical protein